MTIIELDSERSSTSRVIDEDLMFSYADSNIVMDLSSMLTVDSESVTFTVTDSYASWLSDLNTWTI